MNMMTKFCRIDPASPAFTSTLNLQSPEQVNQSRPGAAPPRAPCVPLSDAQMHDYMDLMTRAEALHSAGRQHEAGRVKQVAVSILRTGAPALE